MCLRDGGSTDGTRELARSLGCRIVDQVPACLDSHRRLTDIAGIREQVVRVASHDWILFLDSDELATPALVEEIRSANLDDCRFGAYLIPRLYSLNGAILRCAMTYPIYQIRLVNRLAISGYHGLVHDVPVILEGQEAGKLQHAQLVPLAPLRDLWREWRTYMKLEEVKRGHLSRGEWSREVFRPQLRLVRWLAYQYFKSLRTCAGDRVPIRYELGRLGYELGVIAYTGRRFVGINRANVDSAWG